MKSTAGITLIATLLLYQGCSSTTKTEEKSENQQAQVESLPNKTSQNEKSELNSPTSSNQKSEEIKKQEQLEAKSQPQKM